jgi:hypothetical protein
MTEEVEVKIEVKIKTKRDKFSHECCHWCPVGSHDWQHFIKDPTSVLDPYKLICPEHDKIQK